MQPRIRPLGPDLGLVLADSPESLRTLADHRPGATFLCAHVGVSMNPTLDHSDLLEVSPYGERRPAIGDVVFCLPPGESQAVVHRVMHIDRDGVATRGDNNACDDAWRLRRQDIAGRVVAAWRGDRRRAIAGGRGGEWQARWIRARRGLDRAVSPLLHPFYQFLARHGVVRRVLPSRLRPHVVTFPAHGQGHVHLVLGRRSIGTYDPIARRWFIKRPYRLLVDERALPPAPDQRRNP